jgi:hypothetical protein
VLFRDRVEDAVRRWHALELTRGRDPVIDYDCAPTDESVEPYPNQVAALDELISLRAAADDGPSLAALEAHTTYLTALLGQQIPLSDYIARTQGCSARGWCPSYVVHRKEVAQEALASLDIGWDASTWERLRELEGAVSAAEAGPLVREYAEAFEPTVRKLTGATAEFRLSVETVEEDAYWSYWLDGAGRDARLRINLKNASLTRGDAYRFALHEVLGHALQYASLAEQAEHHPVDWPRLLSIHCPQQVMFEGLAQVLPLIASPDDELVRARTRLDHYLQLVRAELHVMVNRGDSALTCLEHAATRVPFWTRQAVGNELVDRSRNPQLRSYLWAYPAGLDWFVRLYEAPSTVLSEVLRDAYQRPLSPRELTEFWPDGPVLGGDA